MHGRDEERGSLGEVSRDPWYRMQWLVRAVCRYRWLGGGVLAVLVPLVVAGTLTMPRSYYSEARLFVRFGRENQVDPTATGGQLVSLYESRESEINSLLEILRSQAILDRVVAELGPDTILGGRSARKTAASRETAGPVRGTRLPSTERAPQAENGSHLPEQAADREGKGDSSCPPVAPPSRQHLRAVRKLQRDVVIMAPRKSHIIAVGCRASSPELARQIVAKLIEVYQEEHVRVHRSAASYEFFQQRADESLAAWQQAEEQVRRLKDQLGLVTLEARQRTLQDELASLENQRIAVQADLATARAKAAALEALQHDLPPRRVTQTVDSPSAAFDGMRQTLYQLEAQEQELAARMLPHHPRLAAVRVQIQSLREILQQQPDDRPQTTEAINPAWQAVETALLQERTLVEALAARETALAAAQDRSRLALQELNQQAITLQTLQQQATLAESHYREYAQRLEQARINRMLDQERITSLSLVQPASFPTAASSPRRSVVLVVGLAASVLAALATMLGAAWLWPLIETGEALSATLELPLAGLIPTAPLGLAPAGR